MEKKLGVYIKKKVKERGYTQEKIAKKINRNQKTITGLLQSDSASTHRLVELSIILDCNLFEFFTNPGGPLEKYAPVSTEVIRKENEALKDKIEKQEKQLTSLQTELKHIKEASSYLKLTLDAQKAYIQTFEEGKLKK